jgi:hypothetical protein
MTQREWLVEVVVRASAEEMDAITERLGEVMCLPSDHEGPCITPWTLMSCLIDDLDEPRRSELRGLIDE